MKRTPLLRTQSLKRSPINKVGKKKTSIKCPSVAVLDDLFSRYIRAKASFECQLHGYHEAPCSSQMQCSHIISRRFHSVRWDEGNAVCACAKAHRTQHDHPVASTQWLTGLLGEKHLEDLNKRWRDGRKPTAGEKVEIAAYLRGRLKELKG